MTTDLEQLYREALLWDAHAGVFPNPQIDLNLLDEWRHLGASYVSINVGFDVMDWQETLATLAAYRHLVLQHSDLFVLANNADYIERARAAD